MVEKADCVGVPLVKNINCVGGGVRKQNGGCINTNVTVNIAPKSKEKVKKE